MEKTRTTSGSTSAGDSANDGAEGSAQAQAGAEDRVRNDLTELDTEEGEFCEEGEATKEEGEDEDEDEEGQGSRFVCNLVYYPAALRQCGGFLQV